MLIGKTHIDKWQETVNLMAEAIDVPAALIMRLEHDELEVFVSSQNDGNPYNVGERAIMDNSGLYCETVIKKNDVLKVPNALTDEHWKNNPDVKLNMISYLGYPIIFPDKTPFGTLCVLDNKENYFNEVYEKLIISFRDLIELDLSVLDTNAKLENSENKLLGALSYAKIGYWELKKGSQTATWSDQMYTIFGLPPTLQPGSETLCSIIHASDSADFMGSLQNSFATGEEHHIEYKITRQNDGQDRWIECRGNPILDSNGEVEKISGFIQDITERKLSEKIIQSSKKHFQTIFEEAPLGVAVIDSLTGGICDANAAYSKIVARPIEELCKLDWMTITHPDDVQQNLDSLSKMNAGEISGFNMRKRYVQPNGTIRWVSMTDAPIPTEGKTNLRHLCMVEDITENKKAEEKLLLSARVFNDTKEGIVITNPDLEIIDINPAFCMITGYSRDEVIGRDPSILGSGRQSPQFYQNMWQGINKYGHWQGEIWNRTKAGEPYAELLNISAILDANDKVINYVGVFTDITHSKNQQKQLNRMAHYDVLTQLPNRALLSDRFEQAVARSKRTNSRLAICSLDLDLFKTVNDNYGHQVGDLLLKSVSIRIKDNIRDVDTVARQGGDEFILLLGDIELDSFSDCADYLGRLLKSIAQPFVVNGVTHNISASCGLTLYPTDDADLDTLLRHADQALYIAKQEGKNRYCLFNLENDEFLSQKQQKIQEIETALINQEFSLYYQPKVEMLTGKVYGMEALIRWIHPNKGLIPPLDFLPVIEGTSVELELGDWVINEALSQIEKWAPNGINLEVSVNISSYHLRSEHFYSKLEQALTRFPSVSSETLQLEILESSAFGDLDNINHIIKICQQDLGVNFALDDFGTGYSSLTHLRNLPAHTIKIDQSFVRDILDDPSDYSIVEGVIGLAKAFNRDLIAEGVETNEHGLMLLIMGCKKAQGYGISKPMPGENILDWLNNYQPNKQWLLFENQYPTLKEKKLKLFQLITERWINRFTKNITSHPEDITQWPNIAEKRYHYRKWIKREKSDSLFDQELLKELEHVYANSHVIAQSLQKKYQEGKVDAARTGLPELQVAFGQINNILQASKLNSI